MLKSPQKSENYAGIWFMIHILAMNAKDYNGQRNFIYTIHKLADNFLCSTCKMHFKEYLKNNPIENYIHHQDEKGNNIGCFKWSVDFHNAVNARINKPVLDWTTAFNMYHGVDESGGVCNADCGV